MEPDGKGADQALREWARETAETIASIPGAPAEDDPGAPGQLMAPGAWRARLPAFAAREPVTIRHPFGIDAHATFIYEPTLNVAWPAMTHGSGWVRAAFPFTAGPGCVIALVYG